MKKIFIKKNIILLLVITLMTCVITGCDKGEDVKQRQLDLIESSITCDVSSYETIENFKMDGTISVYCAKPFEWFIISDNETNKTYGFIITDNTAIIDNKGRELKHQMFNVGTNDIVRVQTLCQSGSISEEYNDIDGWFILKSVKKIDTLEY
ncbi:MAG: hypothetical protein MJ245_03095 [Clostridia bacterium]|nr:hypothetical protein [Clostridia bacterium]